MKRHYKYIIQCSLLYIVYFILTILLFCFCSPAWAFIFCLLMILPCKMLVSFLASKNFMSVLCDELDAQKFYDTIYQKPMRPPMLYRLNAEWYIGNYKKLIALSSVGFTNTKNIRWKCIYLIYLARAYFDLRDHENLAKTVDAFCQLAKDNNQKEKLFIRYPIFQYYKAYIDKDFEKCISLTETQMQKINKNSSSGKLQWLTCQSNYAISYYELGNIDKAKEIFDRFIETTPNLNNFYNISSNYIEAINKNESPLCIILTDEIDISSNQSEFIISKKSAKRKKVISIILLVLPLIILITFDYINYARYLQKQKEYGAAVEEYENDLNNALSKHYTQAQFLTYFNVDNGDQHLAALCLIDTEERLDLATIITANYGEDLDIIVLVSDVDFSKYYCIKDPLSKYYIGLQIYTTKIIGRDFYQIVEFVYKNTTYWIGVDYIEIEPIS